MIPISTLGFAIVVRNDEVDQSFRDSTLTFATGSDRRNLAIEMAVRSNIGHRFCTFRYPHLVKMMAEERGRRNIGSQPEVWGQYKGIHNDTEVEETLTKYVNTPN
jgi:hypothetical protein